MHILLLLSLFTVIVLLVGCACVSSDEGAAESTGDPVQPVYGGTNPCPQTQAAAPVQRFAAVIELKPEKEQHYRELHANVWPEVHAALKRANISNYSIHLAAIEGRRYLFSYFEYTGNDPEKDFAGLAKDPTVRDKWWPLTEACQRIIPGTPEGELWLNMELLMHIA